MQAPTNAISLPYSLACYLPPLLFTHHNHISVVPPPNTLPPASCYVASSSISLQELLGRALAEARVQRRCLLQHSLTLARRNWSARHLVAIEQRLAGLGCRARLLHWLVGGTLNVLLDQRLCSMLRLLSRRTSWYLATIYSRVRGCVPCSPPSAASSIGRGRVSPSSRTPSCSRRRDAATPTSPSVQALVRFGIDDVRLVLSLLGLGARGRQAYRSNPIALARWHASRPWR